MKCIWCDKDLKKKMNVKRWFITKNYNSGVCYRCVLTLARNVLRALEWEASINHNGIPKLPESDVSLTSKFLKGK